MICFLRVYSLDFFIFSTAIDGKIKAWLYNNMGSRVDYDAQVIGVLQCFIVLMEVDRFLVELVKTESHFLLNGMKVKEPLREHTMSSERNPLVLCSLTQPKINFWLLVKMAKSNFGIWTTLIF
ncbi:hypothetical protein JHK87_018583 [Glycine soja]|nr:hypothetical protein JHK87_018583 [Glycine soja]